MIGFAFIRVIFVAGLIAVLLQCAVYPVRRLASWGAARRLLTASLAGFVAVVAACLLWGGLNGQLADGLAAGGWRTLADLAFFFGFAIFITYLMADRYLADELEHARAAQAKASDAGIAGAPEGTEAAAASEGAVSVATGSDQAGGAS